MHTLVTGMHRSGTSLLAEILVRAGVDFGSSAHWLPADESNPRGYFEDRRVVNLDDRLLRLWNGTWDEPPQLPGNWLDDPKLGALADEASQWLNSIATRPHWGWKDPRACLLLPFWRRLSPDLRCVLCIRDPLEVGRSLQKRDRLTAHKAAFLWLHYLSESFRGVGDAPCAVFFYDELLRDPARQVDRLLRFNGIESGQGFEACLSVVEPSLRRQRAETPSNTGEAPLEWCRIVYRQLRMLFADVDRPLPELCEEAARTARIALGLLLPAPEERREQLRIKFGEMERKLEFDQATIDDLRIAHGRAVSLLAEKELEITTARHAIVQRDLMVDGLESRLRTTEEHTARSEARIDRLMRELSSVRAALDELSAAQARWQERRHQVLGLIGARLANGQGVWDRLLASDRLSRSEANLASKLLLANALSAHFDAPSFDRVEEGDVRFAGWCLHPTREVTSLSLCLNGTPHPARCGLERPDVGAAFPLSPSSTYSGFLVSVPLKPGRYLATLEAQCGESGAEIFVAPRVLNVRPRPTRKRVADMLERSVGFAGYAAMKFRRRLTSGKGFPSWREIPGQIRRARQEYGRRSGDGPALRAPDGFVLPAPVDPYVAWLADNRWSPRQEAALRERLVAAANLPRISVVTPVYRPSLDHFLETAASVRDQVYDNWEWCLADDASNDSALTAALKELAAQDQRVRFVARGENGHISVATNSAAALATGEYVALLDHDDLLSPDCLAEVALYLAAHDDVDVLYSDDDKVNVDGQRYGPQFKPDWSPESLLSQMYFSHLFVVRRTLYEEVGGMRPGFEGSQDHDLALRAAEKARRVAHLPLVLYHWRAAEGSTALSGDAKTYSFDAGMRAVAEALARRGVPAKADRPDWAVQAKASLIRHVFPDDGPRVAILIATRNRVELLKQCVESLAKTRYRNYEIVIIDDHSDDPETLTWLAAFPGRVLRSPKPREGFNYAALHNYAAHEVDAPYLLLLNNDTEVRGPEWLSQMMGFARLQGVGAVGARLLFPDRTVQHAGILNGFNQGSLALAFRGLPEHDPGYLAGARVCRNYAAVTAACLLTPRDLYLAMGGFDEKDFPVSLNDVDYCYRLVDAGYRCVYAAEAELIHHESASRGIGRRVEEIARFRRRYRERPEPYYNANLCTANERFEIWPRHLARWPKRPVKAMMVAHTLDLTGAPICQFEMAAALSDKGRIAPVVVSLEDGPIRSLYEARGIPVRIVSNPLGKVASMADYERELAAFSQLVLNADVEVVYGNTLKTFFAMDAARRLNLPSLWNIRESEPWQTYFSDLPAAVGCRALQCFTFPYRVLFVSNASRAVFEPLNSQHNFHVIHDGLDLEQWEARLAGSTRAGSRARLGIDADELAVMLVGTVCERKGQHDLVRAMALLEPQVAAGLRCFIVGDRPGDYSRELAGLVHKLAAPLRQRVHVIPETRDVAEFYRAADLFVCTSRVESYPRVTLEAMACGLPVISTPAYGLAEQLVHGANALLYQPGDVAGLAETLNRVCEDETLRKSMAEQSRWVLAGLTSFDEMVDEYAIQFVEAREVC